MRESFDVPPTRRYGAGGSAALIPSATMDYEVIGGDPPHRLGWNDGPGWTVQREVTLGGWTDVATYAELPPLAPRSVGRYPPMGRLRSLPWARVRRAC
jgi:hypothetical protein